MSVNLPVISASLPVKLTRKNPRSKGAMGAWAPGFVLNRNGPYVEELLVDYWWDYETRETIRETMRQGEEAPGNKRLPLYDFDLSDFLGTIPRVLIKMILLTMLTTKPYENL